MSWSWSVVSGCGLALAVLLITPHAAAFCRSSSCELGEEERLKKSLPACQRDAQGCVTEGAPLHWPSPCVYYAVQRDGSERAGLDGAQFQSRIQQAFDAWSGSQCAGGGSPRFKAQFQGFVGCHRHEAVCGGADKNVNVMMFHDTDWPATASAIGLTTPSGGTKSGLVVDADLELNSQDFEFTLTPGAPGFFLTDVIAHEVGHFLGLAHSRVEGALMSADYANVQASREELTPDDVAAICAAYPPGATLDCPAPTPPAYDDCQLAPGEHPACELSSMTHDKNDAGCSFKAPRPDSPSRAAVSLTLLALLLGRRRAKHLDSPEPR